jgi:hypothetical protein
MGFDSFGDFTLEFHRPPSRTRAHQYRHALVLSAHRIQVIEGNSRREMRAGVPAEPTLVGLPGG